MLYRCEKCGATTRWYDEKCPGCGAAQTVAPPTSPIELPRFSPSPPRRVEETAAASHPAPQDETPSRPEPEIAPEEPKSPSEETASQDETPAPSSDDERQEPTEPTAETDVAAPKPTSQPEHSQRFIAFQRGVDAWRLAFATETASVTLPRVRVARYALGIVAELVLCFPCALLAAYFFTGALLADRRAQYHAAMLETEKARRTLLVGLGVFAAFLCAFIFYVQSQEIAAPQDSGPAFLLFKK